MVRAVAILAGLLVVLVGPLGGEPPPMVDTTDPLQLAKPVLSRPLSPRRSPAGRISFGGGMSALPDAGSRIRVVVLLGGDETGADQGDAELDRVRWLEHEFVSRASAVGFVPLRGLSHFPVVIGEADAGVIRRLAQDPWVVSIAPDIPLAPARVEGGALVRVPRMRLDTGPGFVAAGHHPR